MPRKISIGLIASMTFLALGLAGCAGEKETSADRSDKSPTSAQTRANDYAGNIAGANILVFSRTAGWRHDSIPEGIAMFEALAKQHSFNVTTTEDPTYFSDARIGAFDAVVFLNTTGDVLNDRQQRAFERYIQSGGGYVGVHAASDTEHDGGWPWYVRLVGGAFAGHPNNPSNVQRARLSRAPGADVLGSDVPQHFDYVDEWYDFYDLDATTQPVLFIDRESYIGAKTDDIERIAWFHDFDGGRSFYTNLGHQKATYADPLFQQHVIEGLTYAAQNRARNPLLDGRPDADRFEKDVLAEPLDEPVSLDVLPDGSILVVERPGRIKRWREGGDMEVIGEPTNIHYPGSNSEFGLLAIAGVPFDKGPLEGAYVMYNTLDGEQILQRVAYIPFKEERFDFSEERKLFDIPTDPNCCHTGGAIRFGPDGYLYIAIGDNSMPHGLDGLAPISDEDQTRDARRTSANTKDLRGKILRIAPSPDGTYEIPEGNLFTDPEVGRPEIYVMGARNPYTIGFDEKGGSLFFGDIGPDGREDTIEGPMGYDEINRVTEAGNFGWPLFIGDNRAYVMTEATENRPPRLYNPLAPVNDSPRNTGHAELPPAQPALIWYPYAGSERFPEMGFGGRNALVAGVYSKPATAGDGAWPEFFNGQLIISDFMRKYLKAVSIDEAGNAAKITSIAQEISLSSPLDLEFGPDGALYIVEYGSRWFSGNDDARLSRISYTGNGNRAPLLETDLDRVAGAAPLEINARTIGAFDPDGDEFRVEWSVVPAPAEATASYNASLFQTVAAEGQEAKLTIDGPGRFLVIARAVDKAGAATYSFSPVDAGNEPPSVAIKVEGNQTFFFPGRNEIKYSVTVTDAEDGSSVEGAIPLEKVAVRAETLMTEAPESAALGHLAAAAASNADADAGRAMALLTQYSCTSCHQIDDASVGPAYSRVAERYADNPEAVQILETSIVQGVSGKWGEAAMPPHAAVTPAERTAIVEFILALNDQSVALPPSGSVSANQFIKNDGEYIRLTASYADNGALGAPSQTSSGIVELRKNVLDLVRLAPSDGGSQGLNVVDANGEQFLIVSGSGANMHLGQYDLTGVKSVNIVWAHNSTYLGSGSMRVELRERAMDGEELAASSLKTEAADEPKGGSIVLPLDQDISGVRDLYLRVVPIDDNDGASQVVFSQAIFEAR